jgi:plasmid stabilization system protein ParE
MTYRLTRAAQSDLREIVRAIRDRQKSPQTARLVAERLKAQFGRLVDNPGIGHTRHELNDDAALVIAVSGVLVIYDPAIKPLTVLRVIHGARDLRSVRPRS